MATASDFVVLPGLTLPLAALRLAWALEARGLRFEVEGDTLVVRPRELLTEHDRELIRRWKRHLVAVVAYDNDAQSCRS